VVPGNANGGMDGVALKALTVSFADYDFIGLLGEETKEPENGSDPPTGSNPQLLNRYSYTTNNPLRYTDPTGHWVASVSFGGTYSWLGWTGAGSVGVTFDGNWNVALGVTVGGGGSTPGAGGAVGTTAGVSLDAPDIYAFEGAGSQYGGSGGIGVVLGGDVSVSKNSSGGYYKMGSITLAAGTKFTAPGIPAEGHALVTGTKYLAHGNVRTAYNNFEQEATRAFMGNGLPGSIP
jgi:hypothetical protein